MTTAAPVFWQRINTARPTIFDDIMADFEKCLGANQVAPKKVARRWLEFDLLEKPDSYRVTIDLPGVTKDQISLEIEGEELKISVQTLNATEEKEARYLHRGRPAQNLTRFIKLPSTSKEIGASLKDGVLTISLQKEETEQTRKIEIK